MYRSCDKNMTYTRNYIEYKFCSFLDLNTYV